MSESNIRRATILACGTVGSWTAHHLAMMGYRHFDLFEGTPCAHLARLGPYREADTSAPACMLLAQHLERLDPTMTVRIHSRFNATSDIRLLRGDIVAELASRDDPATLARGMGNRCLTVALPCTKDLKPLITAAPDELKPGHFGEPIVAKSVAMAVTAEAVHRMVSGYYGRYIDTIDNPPRS